MEIPRPTICLSNTDLSASPWVMFPRLLYSRLRVRRGVGGLLRRLAGAYGPLQLLPVPTNDGRILYLDLRQAVAMPYLLIGEIPYEAAETNLVRSMLRSGDIAADIGANLGWYSTLLAETVGSNGLVYAFEPSTEALRMLRASARCYPQLHVIPAALSDYEGEAEVHVPADLGNASLQQMPGEISSEKCRVSTLDRVLQERGYTAPVFIKCDVEGAERGVLLGAANTLASDQPPIWMIEMNPCTAHRFGYQPDQLLELFRRLPIQEYRCYRIRENDGRLVRYKGGANRIFNAVFVPEWLDDRVTIYRGE